MTAEEALDQLISHLHGCAEPTCSVCQRNASAVAVIRKALKLGALQAELLRTAAEAPQLDAAQESSFQAVPERG